MSDHNEIIRHRQVIIELRTADGQRLSLLSTVVDLGGCGQRGCVQVVVAGVPFVIGIGDSIAIRDGAPQRDDSFLREMGIKP